MKQIEITATEPLEPGNYILIPVSTGRSYRDSAPMALKITEVEYNSHWDGK